MPEEVLPRLQGFRHLAEQIARESPPPRSSDSALTKVVEGTIGKQASSLVVSKDLDWLVPSRTIDSATRKFVRNSAKEADKKALQEWNRSCQARIDQLLKDVNGYLSTVSFASPTLTVNGNSSKLVRRLNVVYRCKKPQSMARALVAVLDGIAILELIPNDSIALRLAEQYARDENEARRLVINLERIIRNRVEKSLSNISSDWWEQRVPTEIRKRAERRHNIDEKVYPRVAEKGDLMAYVGFADYLKIMCCDENWPYFEKVFREKVWLSVKLGELEPIRNALMHSRRLSEHGLEKLRVNSADIAQRLRGYT